MADGSSGASKGSPKESHSNLAGFIPMPQGSKFRMFTPVFGTCNFDTQAIFEKPENKKKLKQAATRMQKVTEAALKIAVHVDSCYAGWEARPRALYKGHLGLQEWPWLTPDEWYRNTTETRWSTPFETQMCQAASCGEDSSQRITILLHPSSIQGRLQASGDNVEESFLHKPLAGCTHIHDFRSSLFIGSFWLSDRMTWKRFLESLVLQLRPVVKGMLADLLESYDFPRDKLLSSKWWKEHLQRNGEASASIKEEEVPNKTIPFNGEKQTGMTSSDVKGFKLLCLQPTILSSRKL